MHRITLVQGPYCGRVTRRKTGPPFTIWIKAPPDSHKDWVRYDLVVKSRLAIINDKLVEQMDYYYEYAYYTDRPNT